MVSSAMNKDTIAAIATPLGTGGISIIKISGTDAVDAVTPIFRPRNPKRTLHKLPSQTMVYGHIHDVGRGDLVDDVLLTILRAPRSYTGEDIVEINCHGGRQVTIAILDMLLQSGIRLAEPGEFTRRAFLNGRMDLTQVEGTIDLIHARTRRAARLGSQMIAHGIGEEIRRLRAIVIEIRALIEAGIEFGEEVEIEGPLDKIETQISDQLMGPLRKLVNQYEDGRLLREGLRVVLAGKPNVGKSSLLNQLLEQDRAIVTNVPGTTRDTIEEGIEIDGIPILICDTAGLGESEDPIERMGQKRTQDAIENADLVLFMVDGSQPLDDNDRDLIAFLGDREQIVLRNKIDLVSGNHHLTALDETPLESYLDISALHGQGVEVLKKRLLDAARVDQRAEAQACLPNLRQKILLTRALAVLSGAIDQIREDIDIDLIAIDLRACEDYFNQILGDGVEQDVLDEIFNRFCIGK
jgi:tRNA modification GTPase